MGLENITEEERRENLEKAKAARQAKKEWAEANLKLSCEDDPLWIDLARKYDLNLPQRHNKAAGKFVQRFLKHFNLEPAWYEELTGFRNGNIEARTNPTMTARQQVGLLLEEYHWQQENP